MRIIRTKNYEELSCVAANMIAAQITLKPNCVLGLATGYSLLGTYKQLIEWYNKGCLDFSQIRTFNMDEYSDLISDHNQSYTYFIHDNLFSHVNIDLTNTNIPDGTNPVGDTECAHYNQVVSDMDGVDLQLLVFGVDGHIYFNEPTDYFSYNTQQIELDESILKANKHFCYSIDKTRIIDICDIFQAKRIVMIASGSNKAESVKTTFFGYIVPWMPASLLRYHPDFTLIADEDALSLL